MARIGAYSPEVAERILRAFQVFESSGLLQPGVIEALIGASGGINKQTEIYFKNNTGEEIPPYACLQVTGTDDLKSVGGTNYLLVSKPADASGEAGAFIFNSHTPVEIDGRGIGQGGRVNVRATYTTGTPAAGQKWQPIVGSFDVEQSDSGIFVAHGPDEIGENFGLQVMKLAVQSAAGGSLGITFTIGTASNASGSGDFGAFKSASCTVISATCGNYDLVGDTVTVYDIAGCYFDETNAALEDRTGHAEWRVKDNSGETACYWECVGLCCPPA